MYYTRTYIDHQSGEEVTQIILVTSNEWVVFPADESNADYQIYLEWVAEGNKPQPWNPEPWNP